MEKQLKCVLLLSLKEISLRRVAVLLWSGPDILASISKLPCYECTGEERQLVDKIKRKTLELELPESLINQMIELVGPMRLEVREWKDSQQDLICPSSNAIGLPDSAKLCWTTAGTINYRKTAEELFRCDKLDVEQRYKIACYYCFEDLISLYWKKLPRWKKDTYDKVENPLWHLTYCWPYILKGKHSELDHVASHKNRRTSFNQFAFEDSAKKGNKTAIQYFFQKLTHKERDASLMRTVNTVIEHTKRYSKFPNNPNHLLYLLSLMTPEQQIEIIKAHPIDVFFCFIRSRIRGLFRENAGLLWALFPPSKYIALLEMIFGFYPFTFVPEMFKELFIESPHDFKTCFVNETSSKFPETPAVRFLRAFFGYKHSECIKVIFRNVDAAVRVKLVQRNFCLFYDYMSGGEWHSVELCLREAMLSKEAKRRLKDDFTVVLEREKKGASKSPVLKRFFEFFDETYASSDQRKKVQKRKARKGVSGTMNWKKP